jgi:hypothetical protein
MKNLILGKDPDNSIFKKTDEGDVFYPFALFGAGYVVGEDQKSRLLALLKSHLSVNAILIPIAIFAGSFRSLGALLFLLPAVALKSIHYHAQCRKILGDAPRSVHRIRWSEYDRGAVDRVGNARLIFILVISALFSAGSLFLLVLTLTKFELETFLIALAALALSSAFLALGCRLAWLKWGAAGSAS